MSIGSNFICITWLDVDTDVHWIIICYTLIYSSVSALHSQYLFMSDDFLIWIIGLKSVFRINLVNEINTELSYHMLNIALCCQSLAVILGIYI